MNVVSLANSGANGVALPTPLVGTSVKIVNTRENELNVFPAIGGTINKLSTNTAFVMAANSRVEFSAATTTQWYTF